MYLEYLLFFYINVFDFAIKHLLRIRLKSLRMINQHLQLRHSVCLHINLPEMLILERIALAPLFVLRPFAACPKVPTVTKFEQPMEGIIILVRVLLVVLAIHDHLLELCLHEVKMILIASVGGDLIGNPPGSVEY